MVARRAELVAALAEEIGAVGLVADILNASDRERCVAETVKRFGRLDVLVNNVGVGSMVAAEDESVSDFLHVVEVNLVAQFAMSQLVARVMLAANSGSIINVASVAGLVGVGQMPEASYAASKGGLISLTRELAAQWARRGVRVNAIAPGWFSTEMTADLFGSEEGLAWVRRKVPLGRGGKDGELDGALLYLASDASSYVTGQIIVVDGGFTAV